MKTIHNVLVLFSGFGLSSYAFKLAGYHILGCIEYWSGAAKVYRANFPGTPVIEQSTRSLNAAIVRQILDLKDKAINVIQISFPCTALSKLSSQEVFSVVNDQFFVATKLALDLGVKKILYENVPPLAEENMKVLLGMMVATLKHHAPQYKLEARILNAYNYGDASARPRIYIMAVEEDLGEPIWPEPVPESQRKYIKDILPDAEYVTSRNFGDSLYLPHEPLPTITGHPDMSVFENGIIRSVTPREYAKGMGLGDDFILLGSEADQKLGIGNGMCIHVTKAIAEAMKKIGLKDSPVGTEIEQ